ncbi:MAG: putative selenate ABC transporter substrate-binding protein [Acidimicrobiales bacterium]
MRTKNRSGVTGDQASESLPATRAPRRISARLLLATIALASLALVAAACGGDDGDDAASGGTLRIAAIPDQEPERLARTYGLVSAYLSEALDVEVEYVPVTDYPASVSLFRTGDLDLVWYGAVTGVQARLGTPGALVLAQRDIDAEFRSVFVANTDAGIEPFDDVAGLSALAGTRFTFGSETSTSSRMMPQFFLDQAGVALEDFDGDVGFAGSHDAVLAAVESGSFETGTLAEAVWYSRVEEGAVDTDRVELIFTTPTYGNYHWLLQPQTLERYGDDFEDRVRDAILALSPDDPEHAEILELFEAEQFIPADASLYETTEVIGRELGVITD